VFLRCKLNILPLPALSLFCCADGRAAARSAALLSNCSLLTVELAQAAASKGTLLLTAADWSMFQLFGVNWLSHVQRSGMDNYLVVALDQVQLGKPPLPPGGGGAVGGGGEKCLTHTS
jgi:hypothetical protein